MTTKVECRQCGELVIRAKLIAHLKTEHPNEGPDIADDELECHQCGESVPRAELIAHLKSNHPKDGTNKKKECHLCGKSVLRTKLFAHLRAEHPKGGAGAGAGAVAEADDEKYTTIMTVAPPAAPPTRMSTDWKTAVPPGANDAYLPLSDVMNVYNQFRVVTSRTAEMFHTRANGHLNRVVAISSAGMEQLCARANHEKTTDHWTPATMGQFLIYSWSRLLAQARVLCVHAAWKDSRFCNASEDATLNKLGLTDSFIVFNTGLFDRNGDALLVVGVQQAVHQTAAKPPYVALGSGVWSAASPKAHELDAFVARPPAGTVLRGSFTQVSKLPAASFVESTDPHLLFDPSLPVVVNVPHIVADNIGRFTRANLIDSHEIAPRVEGAELPPGSRMGGDMSRFSFSRGGAGRAAIAETIKTWIHESVAHAHAYISLVVPQVYHTINDERQMVGSLQLLLPLYCGRTSPPLALCMELAEESDGRKVYRAGTVIPVAWAYTNARLIAPPQAAWLRTSVE